MTIECPTTSRKISKTAVTSDAVVRMILQLLPDCRAIYRFGSWGGAAERQDSDLDIAILPAERLHSVKRWELAQTLASYVRRDVDLVDLLGASTVLRMQVVAHGERLYQNNVNEVEQFEGTIYSSYARLNEERRDIVADVLQRGSVHG